MISKEKEVISRNAKFLLLSHYLFKFGDVLSELFINLFLFKFSDSIVPFLLFNTISFGLWGVTEFSIGGFIKNKSRLLFYRLSLLIFIIAYSLTLLLQYDTIKYFWIIAIFIGLGRGFQYVSYETLKFDLTSIKNRHKYSSIAWMLLYFIAFVAPLISGYLIINTSGSYFNVFGLTSIMFLVSFILSFFLVKNKIIKKYSGAYKPFSFLKKAMKIPDLRNLYTSWFWSGVTHETKGYFLGIVMLVFAFNEFTISTVKAFSSLACVVGGFLFGLVLVKYYTRNIKIAAVISAFIPIVFFININYWTFLIFGVVGALARSFMEPAMGVITLNLINKHKIPKQRVELRSAGAIFSVFGRYLGYILIFLLAKNISDPFSVKITFFALSLTILIAIYYFTKIKIDPKKLKDYRSD